MERSPALAASRRYYPGFLAALFLVLLRTAIGWHFLTEGLAKLYAPANKPFSAEIYLRNASGPFAPYFRGLLPDVDALDRLRRDEAGRPIGLKDRWQRELERLAAHYHLDSEQRTNAETALQVTGAEADAWFQEPDNAQKVQEYVDKVAKVRAVEARPDALAYERKLAEKTRREINDTRAELAAQVDGFTQALRDRWNQLVTDDQRAQFGPFTPEKTTLDWINLATAWGLTIIGGCLLVGFLTPLAALGGAAFLLMIYLSMPPWPGLPVPPNAESDHYWIVNKNLVEMLACLVVATTPNSLWIGLDALLFGWIGRRRRDEPGPVPAPPAVEPPGSNPVVPAPDRPRGSTEPRKPIPVR
jgi:uncharacterized membrane protein YphA (DoxX/SURF4 family)